VIVPQICTVVPGPIFPEVGVLAQLEEELKNAVEVASEQLVPPAVELEPF
jgi:hypothetical protein